MTGRRGAGVRPGAPPPHHIHPSPPLAPTLACAGRSASRSWFAFNGCHTYSLSAPSTAHAPLASRFPVDGGERAVVFNRFRTPAIREVPSSPGTHFKIPLIEEVFIYDVRSRPRIINTVTGTKDLQMISIALRVLSRPMPSQVPKIHQQIGQDYDDRCVCICAVCVCVCVCVCAVACGCGEASLCGDEKSAVVLNSPPTRFLSFTSRRILPSIAPEVLKAVVAQYDAEQLLTQREMVSRQIREQLIERADTFHLELTDISITHLNFGKEFTNGAPVVVALSAPPLPPSPPLPLLCSSAHADTTFPPPSCI